MKIIKVFFVLCVLTSVIGCSLVKLIEKGGADRYGADEMVSKNAKIAPVDLITLLDPENMAKQKASEDVWSKLSDSDKLNRAFAAYYDGKNYPEATQKFRRDRLQDRLLASSNEQCREFKLMVKLERDIPADLIPSAITTITSGLGAIFTPLNTVRALSGSAAIVSGIRAEALQTIYADKTIQVLTAAIDVRRKKKLDDIQEKRAKTIQDYTVEAAISDATEYHAACTLVAALEEVSAAIEKQGSAAPTSAPLAIMTVSPLPENEVNKPYKEMLVATGGTSPYSWAVTGGEKPPGLELDQNTGVLSGKPTQPNTYKFTVQVTDSVGATNKKDFTLRIK
jgi:hypothetical protein